MSRVSAESRSPLVSLAVLCGALALVMGSMSSLTVALPEISRSTGAAQSDLTWIVDSYAVAFAGLLLPCGALGDRYGRRRMLIYGLIVFGAACLLGPIGDDPDMLIASRTLAGLGAALVMPATLSLITTTMRGSAQERAVGVWVATATLGGVLGVIGAGLVLEIADWRAVLYVSAGLAFVLAAAGPLAGESKDQERPPFDLVGAVAGAASIGLVVFGINEAPTHGWDSAIVWSCVLAGTGLGWGFAVIELRRRHPLLDIRIFRSRPVLTGSLMLIALFAVTFAYFFLVVQFQQLIEGRSPLQAGVVMLPAAITLLPLALMAPALVARFGLRVVTSWGLLPMVEAFALLAIAERGDSGLFLAAMLLFGVTLGLCVTPATVAILRSVSAGKQGVASAVNDAVREVGAALGLAVAGSLLASGYAHHLGPAVEQLPAPARGPTEASLAGALQVAEQLGPAGAAALAEARAAFLTGMHSAALACSIFVAVAAVAVATFAPGSDAPN
ncbi:MAG TPA: MFS transporter [Sporichthya sp.]|nr:MFS transporter [Sporichthya sp.]